MAYLRTPDYNAIAAKYGTGNWNALRGSDDPLFEGMDPNANWNAYRPTVDDSQQSTPGATKVSGGARNGLPKTTGFENNGFDFSFPGGRLDPTGQNYNIPTQNYQDYYKTLLNSGVSEEEARTTTEGIFKQALGTAIDLANQNAYGGRNKHSDQSYWQDMWNKDPRYTWERLIGKGGSGSDSALAGPWAGGDPDAEVFGGGGGYQPPPAKPSSMFDWGKLLGGPGDPGVFNNGPTQQVGQDPFSQLITGGYGTLLDKLGSLLESGGSTGFNDSDLAQQFESFRQPLEMGRRAQSENLRAELADRGLLGGGEEANSLGRMEERIAPIWSAALQGLSKDKQAQDAQRLLTTLTVMPAALQAGSQRQGMLADIAIRNLEQNRLWNQFLAEFGLKRDQVMYEIQNGNMDGIMGLLAMYLQSAGISAGGFI